MIKTALRFLLAAFMTVMGVLHFVGPEGFVRAVPDYLPSPITLVYVSGFFEILGGVGLLIPALRKYAAWGLAALFISVFPANLHMAIHHIPFGKEATPDWVLWFRLPFQLLFIAWAIWLAQDKKTSRESHAA